jgi:predicted secreted protein
MSTGSAIAVYFIIWWVTLFAVLPFGVRSQQEAGHVSPGSDPGAPAVARIGRTMLVTSLVAGVVFALFYYFLLPELP